MATLLGAKTFDESWSQSSYGKFVGRLAIPMFSGHVTILDLLCTEDDLYEATNFFFDERIPDAIRSGTVAVKYGYAPATKKNVTTLLKQAVAVSKAFRRHMDISALLATMAPAGYPDKYIRYVNVYVACLREEATFIHTVTLRQEAMARKRQEAYVARPNPKVIEFIEDVKTACSPPTLVDRSKPEPAPEPEPEQAALFPGKRGSCHSYTSDGGLEEDGLPELPCVAALPELVDSGDSFDEEVGRVLMHMPRTGLIYREHLLGDGNDYINRPVESTVDRNWLKGR